MNPKSIISNPKSIIIIGILLLAFAVRYRDYAKFPVHGETQDELAWTWLGTSLLQGEKPTTWSGTNLTGYEKVRQVALVDRQDFAIVTPYLDNPFLFSLIPGSVALLNGHAVGEIPSFTAIRLPMVIIGTLNVLLLLIVAQKLYSWKVAVTASLLYATVPTFVFASRVVVAENALITLMLVAMLLLIVSENTNRKKWIILLGVVGGLAILVKVAGIAIMIASCTVLFLQKKYKQVATVCILSLAIGSLYPLYGLIENGELFLKVISKQSDFSIGFGAITSLFMYPQLVQKTLIDGWMYIGLVALITQAIKPVKLKVQIISIFSLVWLAFILMATPEVISHGWYKYPLFPLLAVAISLFFEECKKNTYATIFCILIVLFPMLRLFFEANDISLSKWTTRLIMALPFAYMLLPEKTTERIKSTIFYCMVLLLILLNVATVFSYSEITYWEDSLHFYPIRQGI